MGLKPRTRLAVACASVIASTVFFFCCALQNPQSPATSTGSVAPQILFRAAGSQVDFDERIKPSLDSIKISALSGGKLVEGKFPYTAHAGKLSNVPAGDAVIDVKALDRSGAIVVAGQLTITVESGRTAEPVVSVGPQDITRPYLSPLFMADGAIRLSWVIWNRASLPGSAQIKIERRIGNGGFAQIALLPFIADGYADSMGLVKNVVHLYQIKIVDGASAYVSNQQSIVPQGGVSGTCPGDMALNNGYCIDRREFGAVLPAQPRGIDNITFTAAKDSCTARGKALCDVFEWNDACQKSQPGQPLEGTVYDMSGGGANDEEWCVGTTVTGPHFGDNACATHAATIAAQPNRGFRCCKMPQ